MSTKTSDHPFAAGTAVAAQKDIDEARALLSRLLTDLQTAQPRRVPLLLHQIQRQRVVIMALGEVVTQTVNPDLHREIALLGKVQDVGLEEEEETEDGAGALGQLQERGISPESAARMARVLSTAAVGVPLTPPTASTTTPGVGLEPDPDFDTTPDD
jgi:hypothetical protein